MTYQDLDSLQPFRPHARYHAGLDTMVCLFRPGTHVSVPHYVEGTNVFDLLRQSDPDGLIVGVQIHGWSRLGRLLQPSAPTSIPNRRLAEAVEMLRATAEETAVPGSDLAHAVIEFDRAKAAEEELLRALEEGIKSLGVPKALLRGDCPVCSARPGEPEGHAEWCPRGLAELEAQFEAHGGRGVDLAEAIDARRGPVAAYQHALQGKPEEGRDTVSLGEAEEAPDTEGEGASVVIRPICPECRSTEVMLAHVHSAQADVPAIVVMCDACRLFTVGQVPREQLDAVIRRVRATRNGDWRYRVR